VLALLTIGLLPIIGEGAFGTAPFLMVVAAFTFPYGWAATTICGVVVCALAIPAIAGWEQDLGLVVVLVAVGFTMLGFRTIAMRENERERAEERRRELDAELAVVAERERVARDVHDILGHSLTVITIKTELAGRLIDLDPQRAKAEMSEVNQLARDAIAGAESALLAAGITADLPGRNIHTPNGSLFAWVLREAVTNVVRHSGASRCVVVIDDTSITVRDNGSGMGASGFGNGLRGLTERVESAGGTLSVTSDADGTAVTAVTAVRT
jgi:two-component system sensor histidine kinase DesK